MRKLLLSILMLLVSVNAHATTYYSRVDGGTCGGAGSGKECLGTTDAAYVSGTEQACACEHPSWVIGGGNKAGMWSGGDTLIIRSGDSFQVGLGMPNLGGCGSGNPWDCFLKVIPSGPDAANPTKILGSDYATGCASKAELWGRERVYQVLNLTDVNNVEIQCVDITDHSSCLLGGPSPYNCNTSSYPYGDFSRRGIYAEDSDSVLIKNVDIHGMSDRGILAGRLSNWTFENVNISRNGLAGFDGDITDADSDTGEMVFTNVIIEYNGCNEPYPVSATPDICWNDGNGGYGDGFGTGTTAGNWTFTDCYVAHNTSDGLDLLYHRSGGTVNIIRSKFEGNVGQQLKTAGDTNLENSILIGDCDYFNGKSYDGPSGFTDCRAYGDTFKWEGAAGKNVAINNTTFGLGIGNYVLNIGNGGTCDGTGSYVINNSIFVGGENYNNADKTNLGLSGCGLTIDWNNVVVNNATFKDACPSGTNVICDDPDFVNSATYDFGIQATSPAIDQSDETISCIGDCSIDYESTARGAFWDIGALEYGTEASPECGDNTTQFPEVCDGTDVNSEDCADYGYVSGTLSCLGDCTNYDFSACVSESCGNGVIGLSEACDDGNLTEGDGCSSLCEVENPNYELFLTYTESDVSGALTRNTHTVEMAGITHAADNITYKDFGAGYFTDFTHRFKVQIDACNDNGLGEDGGAGFWALSANLYGDLLELENSLDGVDFTLGCMSSAAEYTWKLISDGANVDTFQDSAPVLIRYIEVERSGTTLTAKIYSDANYTTLLDTLSVTALATPYRYLYTPLSYNDGVSGTSFSGSVSNLDITAGEAPPESPATESVILNGQTVTGGLFP